MMDILASNEIYQLDDQLVASGLTLESLVMEVGAALANWFVDQQLQDPKVIVLCGPGSNGGDGMALAYHLHQQGVACAVYFPDAQRAITHTKFPGIYRKISSQIVQDFNPADFDCLVDAMFGIGLSQAPAGPYADAIQRCNQSDKMRIAIDIASGVEANTGAVHSPSFMATYTLVVAVLKRGQVLCPGRLQSGNLQVINVAKINKLLAAKKYFCQVLSTDPQWKVGLTPTPASHKYNRGKVSVVMGQTYPGAALLVAQAALAVGAGYVQVYCPREMLVPAQIQYPGLVFHPYDSQQSLVSQLQTDDSQSLVLGPGWSGDLAVEQIVRSQGILVLDGGMLTAKLLAQLGKVDTSRVILTPHQGELARLVGQQMSKWASVEAIGRRFAGVIVAKGYDTLVYQRAQRALITTTNSPFLATAGSGDVLAGMIGGICAQGFAAINGSACAVDLHRKIGERLNFGTTAEKMIGDISAVIRSL